MVNLPEGLRELLRSGFFNPPAISTPQTTRPALKTATPIE